MKIEIKKLILTNFKGIKSLDIDFSDITDISGANATGKSTIFDSFTWLLFGKDAQDRKDFGVKTYDEHGVIIQKIDHEVTGILSVDGVEVKLTRTLREDWVKRRGEEITEFAGNKTIFFVNDVPKQLQEYQAYINSIIPEATFKLLTSPTYFNSLKWNEAREMLTSIAGVPTDEEIAGKDLVSLLETMRNEKKTVEDLKKEYTAKRLNLKKAIEHIPSRIDEVTHNTPEAKDFKAIAENIKLTGESLKEVEKKIADASKGVEEQVRKRSELLIKENNLKTKLQNIEFKTRQEFANLGTTKDHQIRTKEQEIEQIGFQAAGYNKEIEHNNATIETLTKVNEDLRSKWTAKQAEELKFTDTNCPYCSQPLPEDMLGAKVDEATLNFNNAKTAEIAAITKTGFENKERITQLQERNKTIVGHSLGLAERLTALENDIKVLRSTPVNVKSVEAMLSDNAEYVGVQLEVSQIVIPEVVQEDTTELKAYKSELISELDLLKAQLSTKDTIDAMAQRKADLNKEEKDLAQQIASMEKLEFQIDQFTKRKINEVERRVNEMFPSVRFKMFKTLINGGEEPDCICLVNGVPFPDANNAARINTGVEIINVFSQVHNITAPIFVDNAESVNQIIPTQSQLIRLIVSTEKQLTVRK